MRRRIWLFQNVNETIATAVTQRLSLRKIKGTQNQENQQAVAELLVFIFEINCYKFVLGYLSVGMFNDENVYI